MKFQSFSRRALLKSIGGLTGTLVLPTQADASFKLPEESEDGSALNVSAALIATDLKCDYRSSPLGIEHQQPSLSWRIAASEADTHQSAYQIQAFATPLHSASAVLWDSDWEKSRETTQISYSGKKLLPYQRVYWRVRIQDNKGNTSAWSEPSFFEMGLLSQAHWLGAKWIGSGLKRESELAPKALMGSWINTTIKSNPNREPIKYLYNFNLPNKKVVYAGAWWGSVNATDIECSLNGEWVERTGRATRRLFTDFSFFTKPGENKLQLKLPKPPGRTEISFGMQVVFDDGSEQLIQSSKDWTFSLENSLEKSIEKQRPVKISQPYGVAPLGEAKVFNLAPLPVTWYKRDFTVTNTATKTITRARLYMCGLGYFDAFINGKKISDHVLDAGQADYESYGFYQTFDVTQTIGQGGNALSILLGDGWYNQDRGFSGINLRYDDPGLKALLRIEYSDGSSEQVVSDNNWQHRASGTLLSNVYLGDDIDYRLEHDEWQQPGFSEKWQSCAEVPPLTPRLVSQDFEPIRKISTLTPIASWQTGKKTWLFDLGKNVSGWLRLKFNEPSGTTIRIRCTEMMDKEQPALKNVPKSFWEVHASPQRHSIIADGQAHVWEPRFSYHGFRYLEVSGLSQAPKAGDVEGIVVHSDVKVTATFDSNDPLLNRIFEIGVQSHLSNMHSILEDCPHREKCMWGGDMHSSYSVGFHALDSTAFYRNGVNLYYTPPFSRDGIPGNVGVGKRISRNYSDFTWAVSPLFLAYRLYELDGELETARNNYQQMFDFLKYFEKNLEDHIPVRAAHGDHAAPPDIKRVAQDRRLIAAMNYFAACQRFAILADALEYSEDAQWARGMAEKIRASIIEKYYDHNKHSFGNGTHDSLALAFDLPEANEHKAVAQSLAKVYQDNGKQFDGGFMSYFIYPELSNNGYNDLALDMLRSSDYPGLAWSITEFDATSVWEKFTYDKEERENRSLNHHAMNHPSGWLLTHIAGIKVSHENITLEPYIPKDLDRAKATIDTHKGSISSSWRKQAGKVLWTVSVPANRTAVVIFPKESNLAAKTIEPGEHQFEWPQSASF